MDKKDGYMDDLFKAAREEKPQRTLEAVQAGFVASVGMMGAAGGGAAGGAAGTSGAGGGTIGLWTIKTLIMTTLIITSAALVLNTGSEAQTSYENRTLAPIEITDYSELFQVPEVIPADSVKLVDIIEEAPSPEVEPERPETPEIPEIPEISERIVPPSPIQEMSSSPPVVSVTIGRTASEEGEVNFNINNSTSEEELLEIEQQAEDAGIDIDMDYKVRGSLKKLKLKMELETEEDKQQCSISLNGQFDFSIGWILDEEGRAIRFWNDLSDGEGLELCIDHEKYCCSKDHSDCGEMALFDGQHWSFSDEELDEFHYEGDLWEEGDDDEHDGEYFVITEETDEEELEEMKNIALKAGVLFEFKHNAGNKTYYQIMFVSDSGRQTQRVDVTESQYVVELGWLEDEEGRAYRFAD